MSKHNYSQYSNKNQKEQDVTAQAEDITVVNNVVDVEPVTNVADVDNTVTLMDPIEAVESPAERAHTVEGVVVNCGKLNVRAEPSINAGIVCVLDARSELEVDVDKSTDEWFFVSTATGVEGYCMRQYIDANL